MQVVSELIKRALSWNSIRSLSTLNASAAPLDRVTDASRLGLLESERVRLSTVSRARCHGPEHGVLSHVALERLQPA